MMGRMNIQTVAVVGAGIMGRGIAQVAAAGGFETVLNDLSMDLLQKAHSTIQRDLLKAVELGKTDSASVNAALSRLRLETNLEASAASADLVIEAIPERIDLKLDLFVRLDRAARSDAILASNTSSLSITEIAAST